jgi:DNA-binding MarR family transcriptional regulator
VNGAHAKTRRALMYYLLDRWAIRRQLPQCARSCVGTAQDVRVRPLTRAYYVYILLIMNRPSLDHARLDSSERPEGLAQACVCYNTRKVARAVTRRYDDALRPCGLRATQLTLLMVIEAMGEPTISALAEQLAMDRTTLARDLRPMEAAGWVAVVPGRDRRTRITRLTDSGGAILREALPLWRRAQAAMVESGLGVGEWARLRDELERLVAIAQR